MEYVSLDMKIALACVFAQAGLTFYAVLTMGLARLRAIRDEGIPMADIALSTSAYPDQAKKYANNLSNQFEFPVLLYTAVVLAAVFEASSMPFALALMAYVVTRFLHRFIHVTDNRVRQRFQTFLAGLVFLFAAWVFLGLGMLDIL